MKHRTTSWFMPTVLALSFYLSAPSLAKSHKPSAKRLYQEGQEAEAKDDIVTAYDDYAQAFKLDPKDLRYKTAFERTRFPAAAAYVEQGEKLRAMGENSDALTDFLRALEIDPSNQQARQDIQTAKEKLSTPLPDRETSISPGEITELHEVGGPVDLKPISNEPITLHMTEDSKIVYQTVGKAAGINVLFDPDYVSKRIQVDLANVSLLDALRILGTVSGTFWHPITANTIFVAANTRAKRQQLEEEAVQTFYLSNIAQPNDLNDIQTALRNLLSDAKLYGVPSQDAIVMRATPDELLLAQKLIDDLDKPHSEVVVDVALLEVNRDKIRNIGLQLPGSFGVQLQTPNASSTTSSTSTTTTTSTQNLTLNNLANLNGTNFAVTVGAATANLLLSDSDTRVLQDPSIRATTGQQADLKIGSRIPVATGSYQTGAATAIVSSLVNTQFTYLDVGVEIQITPVVHFDQDVTLKIKIVSSQESGSTSIGGITEPIISQRTAEQTVRLKNGEVNILGGFLQRQNLLTVSGTPGLGEIPILKYLFSSQQREVQDDEIVFMLTPHIVRSTDLSPLNLREIDTGTGTDVELRRIDAVNSAAAFPSPRPGQSPGQATATAPASPPAPPAAPRAQAPNQNSQNQNPQNQAPAQGVSMHLVPPTAPAKAGSTFQVAVNLTGGQNVFSIPLLLHYDSTKLQLINVDSGDYLGRDGQAIALVHRDDGHGMVVVSASRPPGVAGVNGSGTVCLLSFKATAPGDASINLIRGSVKDSAQRSTDMPGSQVWVHIQ